jgi:periplasmic protein CpxP/Spy
MLLTGQTWADKSYGDRGSRASFGMHGSMSHGMGRHATSTSHYIRHLLRQQDAIGLTDEQVTRLKAIQLDLDKTRIRTEAEIMVAEREAAALVEDEKADLAAIEAKLKHSEGLGTSLRMAAIKARREALGLLNSDQRKKDELEHEKMMHEHMGSAIGKSPHHGRSESRVGAGHPDKKP